MRTYCHHFDPVVGDPSLYRCRRLTKLGVVNEESIAGGEEEGIDGVPNLVERLPKVVGGCRNGHPRLHALISAKACMGPPSSVVRFHYSLAQGHHVRWDF